MSQEEKIRAIRADQRIWVGVCFAWTVFLSLFFSQLG